MRGAGELPHRIPPPLSKPGGYHGRGGEINTFSRWPSGGPHSARAWMHGGKPIRAWSASDRSKHGVRNGSERSVVARETMAWLRESAVGVDLALALEAPMLTARRGSGCTARPRIPGGEPIRAWSASDRSEHRIRFASGDRIQARMGRGSL